MSALYPIPRHYRDSGDVVAEEGQTSFGPFDFFLFDLADVLVLTKPAAAEEYEAVEGGYTIVPAGELPAYFSVTLGTGLSAGDALRVVGRRLHQRLANVTQGGAVRAVNLETELDRMSAVLQELRRDMDEVSPDVNLIAAVEAAEAFRDAAESYRDQAAVLRAETLFFRNEAEEFRDEAQGIAEFEIASLGNATSEAAAGTLNNTQLMTPRRTAQMGDVRFEPLGTIRALRQETGNETLAATDHGKTIEVASATPATITIPLDATDAFRDRFYANLVRTGAGAVTLKAAAGVTLNGVNGGEVTIEDAFGGLTFYRQAEDAWIVPNQEAA